MADLEKIQKLATEILAHPSAQAHVVLQAEGILQALTENPGRPQGDEVSADDAVIRNSHVVFAPLSSNRN